MSNKRLNELSCPLCGCLGAKPSWLGFTAYKSKEFEYVECLNCKSLYSNPMPDNGLLLNMYSEEYFKAPPSDCYIEKPGDTHRVMSWLDIRERPGVFLDYGCGDGSLLSKAKSLGWEVIGVEFNENFAKTVEQKTGIKVLNRHSVQLIDEPIADIVYLGDVIEHLTNVGTQFAEILTLLKPGGLLLAQGPLENNINLFTFAISSARKFRPKKNIIAPYHVMLATSKGQKYLFQRFGLEELEYSITEVSWPAPERLFPPGLKNLRLVLLFILRRVSQIVSTIIPGQWGNRYFYVGRWQGNKD